MKIKLLVYGFVLSSSILLTGCAMSDIQSAVSNGSAVSTVDTKHKTTNPEHVKLYFGNAGLPKHYQVIGHVSADNYSMIAMQYSQKSIALELKKQAASMGGTGVININTGLDRTTGDVILTK